MNDLLTSARVTFSFSSTVSICPDPLLYCQNICTRSIYSQSNHYHENLMSRQVITFSFSKEEQDEQQELMSLILIHSPQNNHIPISNYTNNSFIQCSGYGSDRIRIIWSFGRIRVAKKNQHKNQPIYKNIYIFLKRNHFFV